MAASRLGTSTSLTDALGSLRGSWPVLRSRSETGRSGPVASGSCLITRHNSSGANLLSGVVYENPVAAEGWWRRRQAIILKLSTRLQLHLAGAGYAFGVISGEPDIRLI